MTVTATWTSPGPGGLLDVANGQVWTETITDALASDLYFLGGATGRVSQLAIAAITSGNFTTTSTSNVDVTNATVTLTTRGGDLLVLFVGPAHATTNTGALQFSMDAADIGTILAAVPSGGPLNVSTPVLYRYTSVSAASHTIKLRAAVGAGGTLNMNFAGAAAGMLAVLEVR